MIVIPAIDLKEGNCVRLEQGEMNRDTVFSDNPAEQALKWQEAGAELLHLVDLDGAFAGIPKNKAAIEAIIKAITIPAQLGGGIRDIATIEAYLSLGLSRVIIGTAAQRNPELVIEACQKFPGRIVVGIDAKNGMVAVQGWAELTDISAVDLAKKFEDCGVAAIIYTDISRDGMMGGPNLEATRALAEAISIPVIASGGVSSLKDIENLMAIEASGVTGAITGKAIYTGAINLREAIDLTKRGCQC
ncbi:1-(5-phosphoribosyl)-5-[(5-phosphoribosylamino)methylideneamino]imidazole-4-carboxamide isomerase [Trichlorobacter lovleyi]|jgi:1-(5-phosphoribosyl)-5-[(5-phosphoribosylamino)methylideneamino] imidazole-4-carboxamide isomerase (EC 5.3.1.16)|uniref:1-(5-phosphoribosyl)-5-[(5-phosphoribosylamino)methylideneamino] imidazole-4-carboxamide isomerase n=1 Tax=Trichlorobacter lovleyi (strain ATCC BAA-1151 / DSM 17278 / SZ) TaxID=398767 RepID=HIS4_TRIL1|nr:1-(5-phosphoribosyl)-5-[(5-phosphoribosylamino)methylideneamino]imidazole-4-carboxamide isomerase [Trichlorobacter lovleyi]B3E618.1 RecName: Full=1-(5-phosphoribosyl)-5-[(5-phosphoribosylamino)methylideneamino] imidazole-4-carboxamide isomerase; AltName: Full=Phosphoribosylformimino-5-aminoimidazole carboxamide ribotide isomerase [Trichlorobacter lovleyi SZ]ACD94742.1 phosphoribosylformimino-5-aminoimidazole carboxamide ribotide isomerase [Trichlorobacter lovleyi SZ]